MSDNVSFEGPLQPAFNPVTWLGDLLHSQTGLGDSVAHLVALAAFAIAVILLSIVANFVVKKWLLHLLGKAAEKSRNKIDDLMLKSGVFNRAAHIAPALVIYSFVSFFDANIESWLQRLCLAYMAIIGMAVIDAVLNVLVAVYNSKDRSSKRSIRGYVQTVKLFIFIIGGIWVLAMLMDRSPWKLLSGIGALSAVLMLIFKDSILGLVASVQMQAYDMVRRGDWLEMPKYGADGDVLELSLHTVKVRNWDKTITTIPTHALIADSFKNWRGMQESGGRRIKRSLNIDMQTIKFCDEPLLDRFEGIRLLKDYLAEKRNEVRAANKKLGIDDDCPANGRHLTNVGTFRAYVEAFLRSNAHLHDNMTFLVRQLAPGESGLPIEIYVFCNDTRWVQYEAIQADIFDHILAALPLFDLSVHQSPGSHDIKQLGAMLQLGK